MDSFGKRQYGPCTQTGDYVSQYKYPKFRSDERLVEQKNENFKCGLRTYEFMLIGDDIQRCV